jgi:hypothetical protein
MANAAVAAAATPNAFADLRPKASKLLPKLLMSF